MSATVVPRMPLVAISETAACRSACSAASRRSAWRRRVLGAEFELKVAFSFACVFDP